MGYEDIGVILCQFNFIVCRPVIFDAEHVRDQVEDRIANLHLFVPEFVRRSDTLRIQERY